VGRAGPARFPAAALIILALAGIQLRLPSRTLTAIFVLDVSDSIPPAEQQRGEQLIREAIEAMPLATGPRWLCLAKMRWSNGWPAKTAAVAADLGPGHHPHRYRQRAAACHGALPR
jgi:hypothetical protein